MPLSLVMDPRTRAPSNKRPRHAHQNDITHLSEAARFAWQLLDHDFDLVLSEDLVSSSHSPAHPRKNVPSMHTIQDKKLRGKAGHGQQNQAEENVSLNRDKFSSTLTTARKECIFDA